MKCRADIEIDEDPYAVLGLRWDFSDRELRAAHRRLVRMCHPDRNREASAAARFQRIQRAYEILRDPSRRASFDRRCQRNAAAQSHHPVTEPHERRPTSPSGFVHTMWQRESSRAPHSDFVSAAEDWLAAELERLGPQTAPPDPPQPCSRVHFLQLIVVTAGSLRVAIPFMIAGAAAVAGCAMMVSDFYGSFGAGILVLAPFICILAGRLMDSD
jgi:hypothetical protein